MNVFPVRVAPRRAQQPSDIGAMREMQQELRLQLMRRNPEKDYHGGEEYLYLRAIINLRVMHAQRRADKAKPSPPPHLLRLHRPAGGK